MISSDENGIHRVAMSLIDLAFRDETEAEEKELRETDETSQRKQRAFEFSRWLDAVLGDLRQEVCFVDYTVFQDPKDENPYFYLVSPNTDTTNRYRNAVKELVEGNEGEEDCFSVAFHPHFVGVSQPGSTDTRNRFFMFSISSNANDSDSSISNLVPKGDDWDYDSYPLWPQKDSRWPPTTKGELQRICGRHELDECLLKFQSILTNARHELYDSSRKRLRWVFCVPFLILRRPDQTTTSNLPFSEIAAALFLGVSSEANWEDVTQRFRPFLRTLALRTYSEGIRKAGYKGKLEGVDQAIETFAHQIKGIANAMSSQWAVDFDTWGRIQRVFSNDKDFGARLKDALVLPAPELIQAVRDALVLWAQTRRVNDLYATYHDSSNNWPAQFSDVVYRAGELIAHARFATESVNRNLAEMKSDIVKVWRQTQIFKERPRIIGNIVIPEPRVFDPVAEAWICNVTRLLAAIFDNSLEHGNEFPTIKITSEPDGQAMHFIASNPVVKPISEIPSRLRLGMKGNEVLLFLAARLQADLKLPNPIPAIGESYLVEVHLPLPRAFFQN